MDQVVNHAAKWRYMSGGQVSVPFVIRGPISNGIGMAAQHSQSLEAWFVHTPGLSSLMPSTPYDAKGLLKAAIRDDNPVSSSRSACSTPARAPVPETDYVVPLGVADVKRAGPRRDGRRRRRDGARSRCRRPGSSAARRRRGSR